MTTPRMGQFTEVKLLGGSLVYREIGHTSQQWIEKIEGMKRRAVDLSPLFVVLRPLFQQQTAEVFAAGGRPATWAPLSPGYAAWKASRFPGKTIMRRTDRLYQSLVGVTGDSVWAATPRTVRYGTKVPYYRWHVTGTRRMPPRPVVVTLRQTGSEITRRVSRYVRTGALNG